MVLLSALAALSMASVAHGASDDLVDVVFLPVQPTHSLSAEVPAAVRRAVPEGVRLVPLSEQAEAFFVSQPTCPARPSCVRAHTGELAELVLLADLELRSGGLALTLKLLQKGAQVDVRSTFVKDRTLSAVVETEVAGLLAPQATDYRLYMRAKAGDEASAKALREHFPSSPWTSALNADGAAR